MNKQDKLTEYLVSNTFDVAWDKFYVPPGLIIELGVYRGDSFNRICEFFHDRQCYGFDSFYGLPDDYKGGGLEKGAFSTNGVPPDVRHNGHIICGHVEDTLRDFLQRQQEKIAFVNFDMDLYAPTVYALQEMNSYFQQGTVLRFDEIYDLPQSAQHEEKAVREWLETTQFDLVFLGMQGGHSRLFKLL